MITKLSTLATGAFAVATALICAPKPSIPVSTNAAPQAINVTRLYETSCAKCHGVNAEGGGGGTKSLVSVEKFDQKYDRPFFDAIKNGVPDMGMDPFGQTLSDETVWALVVHIRERQAEGLRAKGVGFQRNDVNVYRSKRETYSIESVIDQRQGLRTPWAIDWLPDGKVLVTNRPGPIFIFDKGQKIGEITGLPETVELGQGGRMDVAVHPDYAKNGWIYLSYAEPGGGGGLTKIVRGKLVWEGSNARWSNQQTIFEADKKFYTGAGIHFGSRIVFDRKGHVFFNVGERGGNMLAQKLDNPFGKIYRLNEDGSVPDDNPFVTETKGLWKGAAGIWTLGHRNPQGLTIDPEGKLWDTEHGPRGGDEVNLIQPGSNYGWPVVALSINYNDSPFRTPWPKNGEKFVQPVFRWLPSIGACGMDTMRGKAFPGWSGDLLAGGLSGKNLDRFRMKNDKLIEHEELLYGLGRVREVAVGPDGLVYVALNEPDKIIRLVPATKNR